MPFIFMRSICRLFLNTNGLLSMKKANLELVEKALQKHGGNRKAAAKELGISERTVYRKLDQIKKKK